MKLTSNDVLKLREVIARNIWLITDIKKLSFGQDRILKNIIEELIEYENSLAGPKPDPKLISYIEKGYIPKWFAIISAILLLLFIFSVVARFIIEKS